MKLLPQSKKGKSIIGGAVVFVALGIIGAATTKPAPVAAAVTASTATAAPSTSTPATAVPSTPAPTAVPTPLPTAVPTPVPTPVPTAVPTAVPTPVPAPTSGYGDTTVNPDTSYICADSGDVGSGIIAYSTIAGPNDAAGQVGCSTMEQNPYWSSASTIPGGSLYKVADCYDNVAGDTIRIYTALSGDHAITRALCASLLSGGN